MVDLTGGPVNWDPTWTDSQPDFASPWKTRTEIDEDEEGDKEEALEVKEGDGDTDWCMCHDGERWWVGCPKAMSQDEVMASWGPSTNEVSGKATAAPTAATPNENDTNTGDVKGSHEVESKEAPAKTEGEPKETAKVEQKEVEPETKIPAEPVPEVPSEPEVTPAKPEPATKATKRKMPEAGQVLWKPLTKAGYDDFLDSCNGCGRDVHDPPEAFLHPTAPERPQETKVVWRPCTHTGVASFSLFFGQVAPEKMNLKDLITYTHGLDGDWTLIPSTTPGFVVEIAKYISALRSDWGVVEPHEVDFWMRQRSGYSPQKGDCLCFIFVSIA